MVAILPNRFSYDCTAKDTRSAAGSQWPSSSGLPAVIDVARQGFRGSECSVQPGIEHRGI